MFRIVQVGSSMPWSWPVDPNAVFEGGMIAQLKPSGNQTVCGVSDGRQPIGIIDDTKTTAFYTPAIDEIVIAAVPNPVLDGNNQLVTPYDVAAPLANAAISPGSFTSDFDVMLNPRNGIVTFLAGTPLNFDMTGSGTPDSFRARVSYSYQIPNVPGVDTTIGSNRVTVWYERILFQTDQYDTSCRYPINATLFVNEQGKLTTRRISAEEYPGIAVVIGANVSPSPMIEAMWL